MLLIQDQKSAVEPAHRPNGDLPPAYDALSIHQPASHRIIQYTSLSAFSDPNEGSNSEPPNSDTAILLVQPPVPNIDISSPSPSSLSPSSSKSTGHVLPENFRHSVRKNASWLSLLPFASSISAKRVRQSVLSVISDLAVPTSRVISKEQKNAHEILASLAETCTEHKLSLSTILQETSVADHTPMYWAVVNYREELLVTLLVYSRPLSIQAISDIRRACLASSNQALFHALRVCRPPFHETDGVQVPSLRAGVYIYILSDISKKKKLRQCIR